MKEFGPTFATQTSDIFVLMHLNYFCSQFVGVGLKAGKEQQMKTQQHRPQEESRWIMQEQIQQMGAQTNPPPQKKEEENKKNEGQAA